MSAEPLPEHSGELWQPRDIQFTPLTRQFARDWAGKLTALARIVPAVRHTTSDILDWRWVEGRLQMTKPDHSWVAQDRGGEPRAVVLAYERGPSWESRNRDPYYYDDSVYLEIVSRAVGAQWKGLGAYTLHHALAASLIHGYTYLRGPLKFSLSTSNEPENRKVRELYESFGFRVRYRRTLRLERGWRQYASMWASEEEVKRALIQRSQQ